MQPLGVSLFSSFKSVLTQEHNARRKSNVGVTCNLHHVPLIAEQPLGKSGFKTTGIFPFNPNILSKSDYVAAELSGKKSIWR